jgi:hypothetical protein
MERMESSERTDTQRDGRSEHPNSLETGPAFTDREL